MNLCDRGHKVENIALFALTRATKSSSVLEMGPRRVGTAEHELVAESGQ